MQIGKYSMAYFASMPSPTMRPSVMAQTQLRAIVSRHMQNSATAQIGSSKASVDMMPEESHTPGSTSQLKPDQNAAGAPYMLRPKP